MPLLPEVVVIPAYKRPELLWLCISELRKYYSGSIAVFPDRGDRDPIYYKLSAAFDVTIVPSVNHGFYGNSFNALRALSFGHDVAELVHYIEEDVLVTDRWYLWTHAAHAEGKTFSPIFCSAGWIGSRSQPCRDQTYLTPWIYIPQFSIERVHLNKILRHFKPEYTQDMAGYCQRMFPNSPLNKMGAMNNHYEIDGLIQHMIAEDQSLQVAWNGYPTVKHLGFAGYNRGGQPNYDAFFKDANTFGDRLDRLTEFSLDPSWRLEYFEREIVEREEGGRIAESIYEYRVKLEHFSSTFKSRIPPRGRHPKYINGAPIPDDARITLLGRTSIP